MTNSDSRQSHIAILAGHGETVELKKLFESGHSQLEIDVALENAIAYSQIITAEYLLSLGAEISNYNYQGAYYAAHNNELEGVKFAVAHGVDINVNNGMLLNTSVVTAINTKSIELVKWLLDNGADPKLISFNSMKLVYAYGNDELQELIREVI
jgi:hypothetical protein